MPLSKATYLDAIRRNSAELAAAARLGVDAPVPCCPGWTVAYLVVHVGGVQRTWAEQVRSRSLEYIGFQASVFDEVPGLGAWAYDETSVPDTLPAGTIEWFERGAEHLAAILEAADPEEAVWSWSHDHTVLHHLRMMTFEAAVHRRDAQAAHGIAGPIGPELARDGTDHLFEIMLPARRMWTEPRPGAGETYHYHQTDGDGEWTVRFEGGEAVVTRGHRDTDVTLSGPAENLFLYGWGRVPVETVQVTGDRALLDRYTELVPPA